MAGYDCTAAAARLLKLETAYDDFLTGGIVTEHRDQNGETVKTGAVSGPQLSNRIERLKAEMALNGCGVSAVSGVPRPLQFFF